MKLKKLFFEGVLLSVLLSGCFKVSQSVDELNDVQDLFGQTEKVIEKATGWNFEEKEKKRILAEKVSGYTVELKGVKFLETSVESITLMFLEGVDKKEYLTSIFVQYPVDISMDKVCERLENSFGEEKKSMYCSWPSQVYWPDEIWNLGHDDISAYQQERSDGKRLWGSQKTIADLVKEEEQALKIYENWQQYSRIYAQSAKNSWDVIKEEPLLTAVLFTDNEKYENVLILDGFHKFIGSIL